MKVTKAEEKLYEMIFTNGKQMLSPEINSCDFHVMTHEDTEILGMFCDFSGVHGKELKKLLIRGCLNSVSPNSETHGKWRRILIRNDKSGCVGTRMICSVCNGDNGHDEYMNYCPNCGTKMDKE